VNTEKLMIKPLITPNGRRLPLAAEEDRTIGNTGSTQGDSTVTRPDKSEKIMRMNIVYLSSKRLYPTINCQKDKKCKQCINQSGLNRKTT
jgi:hypothetical protein